MNHIDSDINILTFIHTHTRPSLFTLVTHFALTSFRVSKKNISCDTHKTPRRRRRANNRRRIQTQFQTRIFFFTVKISMSNHDILIKFFSRRPSKPGPTTTNVHQLPVIAGTRPLTARVRGPARGTAQGKLQSQTANLLSRRKTDDKHAKDRQQFRDNREHRQEKHRFKGLVRRGLIVIRFNRRSLPLIAGRERVAAQRSGGEARAVVPGIEGDGDYGESA
jgi:hypothetical protein